MRLSWLYSLLLAMGLAGFPAVAAVALLTGVSSTPLSIAMRGLMVALSGALLAFALLRRHTALLRGWHWLLIVVFWTAYAARMYYSASTEAYLLSRPPQDYWIWSIGACLVPMLGLLTKPDERAWANAYRWSMVLLLIAAVIVARYGGTLVNPDSAAAYDTGRLRLESLNPISVGHLGVSLLLLSLWPIFSGAGRQSRWLRVGLLVAGALGLYLVVASASRGPIASLLVVALFYSFALNARRAWKPIVLFALVMTLGYAVALHVQETGQFSTLSRITSAFSGDDVAVTGRQQALSGAIHQFLGSPLVGDGLEERTTHFYPHNVVVESLMATGLGGGIPFLALVAIGVRSAYRIVKGRTIHGWVALIFMQYLLAAQFSGSLYNSTTMWAFLGAVISLWMCLKGELASRWKSTSNLGTSMASIRS